MFEKILSWHSCDPEAEENAEGQIPRDSKD